MSLKYEPFSEPLHISTQHLRALLAARGGALMIFHAVYRSKGLTKSTPPHEIVILLFDDLFDDFKLTIVWGDWLSKPHESILCVR